jgi:hypothetical protein
MPEPLTNLPPLTREEGEAVGAYLTAIGSLVDAADALRIPLARFLDLLASPNVQTHLDHAERMTRRRAEIRAADAACEAVHTLEQISQDTQADPTERRRAATTLVRVLTPARTARRRPSLDVTRLATLLDKLEGGHTPPPHASKHHAPKPPPNADAPIAPPHAPPNDAPPRVPTAPGDQRPRRQAQISHKPSTCAPDPQHPP